MHISDSLVFDTVNCRNFTDEMLKECAKLFSDHYGVWSSQMGTKAGKHVSISPARLKSQLISDPANTVVSRCKRGDDLIGQAFATVWEYKPGCHAAWVTQLVVHKNFRRRYIATLLLQNLKLNPLFCDINAPIDAIGLASTHPASINTLAKFSYLSPGELDLSFISKNAREIMKASPVPYIRDASSHLKGSIFEKDLATRGVVSSAFTDFYVDHEEPLSTLKSYVDAGRWCLGDLLDGHEFLIIVPVAESTI
ncbi:hypothetical protein JR316_0004249 [Psilocybe cubensis]|uniref:N-acetyltransferase domain-containing protein n=2 Tax=Psilocybe cubensis TaxID=181762 RepID=A0A8H8CKG8_PSICU|nr:hypothetical protein JR316_0004249 [Psilocybe cubensis]KAH9482154.1 hypothetical protein JR316_0004249 [Psilocybe cubensis]